MPTPTPGRTRNLVLCFASVASFALPLAVQEPADPFEGFDAWVDAVMAEWDVPGLGVAVVHEGAVVLAQGYGMRDLEEGLPVTPDTLFPIGSNTKSFTATLIGMLVDEGRLGWDDPIRTHLPDLQLHDAYATTEMTAEDLLTHRSGLPRHDLYWLATNKSRAELFAGLQYLEPSRSFRSEFQYQNLMYLTAGILTERITGETWEAQIVSRILRPLGMDRAVVSIERMQADPDFARGYAASEGKIVRIPYRTVDEVGPAGSIDASAADMAKYLRFHLDRGKVGDEQLLSEASWRAMQSPQMVITGPLLERLKDGPEVGAYSYGLGLMVGSYRGRTHVRHGGGIDGFISAMEWLPNEEIGVIALSNSSANGTVPNLVARNVFDRLLGLEPIDWAERARERDKEMEAAVEEMQAADLAAARPGTSPSHALEELAGLYEHAGYGTARVELVGDTLQLQVVGLEVPLRHYHYDVFLVPYDLPEDDVVSSFGGWKVRFEYDDAGEITRLSVPLEGALPKIAFDRVQEPAADD